jgi:acyl carrier protein
MEPIEDRVRRVVAEVFGLDPASVTLATANEQVESWDSLNILNLLMAVEEEFGISLSPEEAGQLTSVAGIVALVRSKQ